MIKYSETLQRYAALTEEGKPCEILERVTWEKVPGPEGAQPELKEILRRYDLRTGERLHRISESEFMDDETGARLRLA